MSPPRTPQAAIERFLEPLRRCVHRVTPSILTVLGDRQADTPHEMQLNRGERTPLHGDAGVELFASMGFAVVTDEERGGYKVRTTAYRYHLLSDALGEVLLFHWHPDGPSPYTSPHLHIGRAVRNGDMMAKAHIPTGRIALEEVLLLAIRELGVDTDLGQEQGVKVIQESLEVFRRYRTWW